MSVIHLVNIDIEKNGEYGKECVRWPTIGDTHDVSLLTRDGCDDRDECNVYVENKYFKILHRNQV
jgi:hypothetical protein